MPAPIKLKDVRINGIAVSNALPGQTVQVLTRAAVTSDQPEFYEYMRSFSRLISGRAKEAGVLLTLDRISAFVMVVHKDTSADLYLQDIPILLEVLAKKDLAAGEVVYQSGIADVRRVKIPGLVLKPDDSIVVCMKVGWKFALFFDLSPNRVLDVDSMETMLARTYRALSFQDLYDALGDQTLFTRLLDAGWFPFVEAIGGDFEPVLKAYKANFNIQAEEDAFLGKFDAARIDEIAKRWWARPLLSSRKEILEPALDAFKRGDSVSCLKIILTEMEGILQSAHIADAGKGVKIKALLEYAAAKGLNKTGDVESLFFPQEFLTYLKDYTYASFDPTTPQAGVMSRHSAGHGGAIAEAYTPLRALQAILTLDQLAFYF